MVFEHLIEVKDEELFWAEWKSKYKDIVTDGMVCPEQYLSPDVRPRLLFLMKEVNGGRDWDLREFLREGGRAQSWDNIARWVEGIRRLDEDICWSELEKGTEERRKKYLTQICVVNVKKTAGGHTSDRKQLAEAAKDHARMLKKQLAIYRPEVIICCGTGDFYYDTLMEYDGEKPKWEQTSRGIWYVREKERVMISYVHPEARVKDCLIYYGVVDAVKEIFVNE